MSFGAPEVLEAEAALANEEDAPDPEALALPGRVGIPGAVAVCK